MEHATQTTKEQLRQLEQIFPLIVKSYGFDYGMGEWGTRHCLLTQNNDVICHSDYAPDNIDKLNTAVINLINLLKEDNQMSTKRPNPNFKDTSRAPVSIDIVGEKKTPDISEQHFDASKVPYVDVCVRRVEAQHALKNAIKNAINATTPLTTSSVPEKSVFPIRTLEDIDREIKNLQTERARVETYNSCADNNPRLLVLNDEYNRLMNLYEKIDSSPETLSQRRKIQESLFRLQHEAQVSYSLPKRFAIELHNKFHCDCHAYQFNFDFNSSFDTTEMEGCLHNWDKPAHRWWLRRAETFLEPFSEVLDKVEPTLVFNALLSTLAMHSDVPGYMFSLPIKKRKHKTDDGN